MCLTKNIPKPNKYIKLLCNQYTNWAFDESIAPQFKGKWRSNVFCTSQNAPLDLELGTGNGFHFAHYAQKNSQRSLIGIELKYKPLIQAIKRARVNDCENARMVRFNAFLIDRLFAKNELNNVIIHFPDPWLKKKQWKHRFVNKDTLNMIYNLQQDNGLVEIKTDSRDYFDWMVNCFSHTKYQIEAITYDLHNCEWAKTNFITHFERIFLQQNLPIHYARLKKI